MKKPIFISANTKSGVAAARQVSVMSVEKLG